MQSIHHISSFLLTARTFCFSRQMTHFGTATIMVQRGTWLQRQIFRTLPIYQIVIFISESQRIFCQKDCTFPEIRVKLSCDWTQSCFIQSRLILPMEYCMPEEMAYYTAVMIAVLRSILITTRLPRNQ